MKYISNAWDKKFDGIQYFVQRLQEMLFHYSNDIFRAPVHNTQSLLHEFVKTQESVLRGEGKPYQLDSIIEELSYSFANDKILKTVFGINFTENTANKIHKENLNIINYLYNKIPFNEYYSWCQKFLKEHVVEASHKEEIEFGLRCWISSAIKIYSPQYIYNHLISIFTDNTTPVESIMVFLDSLDFKKETYRVYFLFKTPLMRYKELLNQRLGIIFTDDGFFNGISLPNKMSIGFLDVETVDSYTAMQRAWHDLDIFIKFYKVISNRRDRLIGSYGYVRATTSDFLLRLPVKNDGFKLIESNPFIDLSSTIDTIIIKCQQKNTGTYEKLNRIIDLHNESLQQNLNNSFLNLWSILEIICVEQDSISKNIAVVKGVLPILESDYFSSIFVDIAMNLQDNLSKEDCQALVEQVEETGDVATKIAALCLLDKYNNLLESYFENQLKNYPILRNKIYKLYLAKTNKTLMLNQLKLYSTRVQWHLYRLYRIRNAIVHSGRNDKNIQSLGEHLHIYVDHVINEILFKLAEEKYIRTIKDVLVDSQLVSDRKRDCLSKNEAISFSDIQILMNSYFYPSHKE